MSNEPRATNETKKPAIPAPYTRKTTPTDPRLLTFIFIGQVLIGIALYALGEFFLPTWDTAPSTTWATIGKKASMLGALIGLAGFFFFILRSVALVVWNNYLLEPIENIITMFHAGTNSIAHDVESISRTAEGITEAVDKCAKRLNAKPPMGLVVPAVASPQERHNAYLQLCSMTYGSHSQNELGFACFIKETLLDPFCCAPHKSRLTYNITAEEYATNDNFFKWTVKTDYRFHHIMLSEQGKTTHPLSYFFTSYAPGLSTDQWLNEMNLKIYIGGDELIKDKRPHETDENIRPRYTCEREDDWITVVYENEIDLVNEWTNIRQVEIGLNSKDDNIYSVTTTRPIYGLKLDMTLPNGYEFNEDPHIATASLLNAMAVDGIAGSRKVPKPESDSPNHIRLLIEGQWILPGVVVNFSWKKTD